MARKKKANPLVHAATLLPLAIGLGSNLRSTAPETLRRGAAAGEGIVAMCTLPFAAIQEHHPIDDSCTPDGAAAANTPQSAQNDAKNNFCAAGPPVNIDFQVLRQLQDDAANSTGSSKITFGSDRSLPEDRSLLSDLPTKAGSLSEGTVVRLAAFVMDAHYSNVGKGESVNCKQPDQESNDIHIVLADNENEQDECNSVTAEMSPHFRPAGWNPDDLNKNNLNQKKPRQYRFTGQLFFDASHRPCSNGKGSPKRSSLWEVHPVYAVDICAIGKDCKVDSEENWEPFAEQSSETRLLLPDEISSRFGRRAAQQSRR